MTESAKAPDARARRWAACIALILQWISVLLVFAGAGALIIGHNVEAGPAGISIGIAVVAFVLLELAGILNHLSKWRRSCETRLTELFLKILEPRKEDHATWWRRRSGSIAAIGATVLGAVAIVVWIRCEGLPNSKSIAVLPFANMSEEETGEYFSRGLSEEVLNALAHLPEIRVIARTSTEKCSGKDVREIGKLLDVATVLEGSVRRSGHRLRITVQLINARNGFHMWSETYDRELGDVLVVQQDIASRVAQELKIRLGEKEKEQLRRHATEEVDAFDFYLRGKAAMAQRTQVGLEEAIGYFQRAIDADPDYSLAHVGLADTYVLLMEGYGQSTAENLARVEESLTRALAIDDRLGEAYASMAQVRVMQARPKQAAEDFERAIALAPNYATAYHWYGNFLSQFELEAVKASFMLRKAVELDPLSPIINCAYAANLQRNGNFDEALQRLAYTRQIAPDFANAYELAADIQYNEYGQVESALQLVDRSIELDPGNARRRFARAHYLAGAGHADLAVAECASALEGIESADAHSWAGDLLRQLGRLDAALSAYRLAAAHDPTDPWPRFSCAVTLFDLGETRYLPAWIGSLPAPVSEFVKVTVHACEPHGDETDKFMLELADSVGADVLRDELAEFDLVAGRYTGAINRFVGGFPELFEKAAPQIHSANLRPAIFVAAALLGSGQSERAGSILGECAAYVESLSESQRQFEYGRQVAEIYALQGRTNDALDALRTGVGSWLRSDWCRTMRSPMLISIRQEPEFEATFDEVRNEIANMRMNLSEADLIP